MKLDDPSKIIAGVDMTECCANSPPGLFKKKSDPISNEGKVSGSPNTIE
ncbi:MAG: hypothetical protein ACJZ9B_04685 [Coraliomargaritaceae bacterium]